MAATAERERTGDLTPYSGVEPDAAWRDEVRRLAKERDAVLRRFYRSDKIRNTPGVGLGLSLVAAIVKLHGFRLWF